MEAEAAHQAGLLGELVTVQEAAALLRVSPSTVWRWIKAERLPAYHLSGRRVWLKRADLAALIEPARTRKGRGSVSGQRQGHERRMTESEQRQMLAALETARVLREEMLAKRGGRLFRSAAEDIAEARRERSAARP